MRFRMPQMPLLCWPRNVFDFVALPHLLLPKLPICPLAACNICRLYIIVLLVLESVCMWACVRVFMPLLIATLLGRHLTSFCCQRDCYCCCAWLPTCLLGNFPCDCRSFNQFGCSWFQFYNTFWQRFTLLPLLTLLLLLLLLLWCLIAFGATTNVNKYVIAADLGHLLAFGLCQWASFHAPSILPLPHFMHLVHLIVTSACSSMFSTFSHLLSIHTLASNWVGPHLALKNRFSLHLQVSVHFVAGMTTTTTC